MPRRRLNPSAAPRNSARSVAIAITSAWIQRSTDVRREKLSRQTSGRFMPVAMPSFAESVWMSIAIRLRGDDHPDERVAELRPAGDVRREVARVDVGDGGDEGRPEERQEPELAAALEDPLTLAGSLGTPRGAFSTRKVSLA